MRLKAMQLMLPAVAVSKKAVVEGAVDAGGLPWDVCHNPVPDSMPTSTINHLDSSVGLVATRKQPLSKQTNCWFHLLLYSTRDAGLTGICDAA